MNVRPPAPPGDRPRVLLSRASPFARYRNPHPQEAQLPFTLAYLAGGLVADGWAVSVSDGWLEPQFGRDGACRVRDEGWRLAIIDVDTLNADGALRLAESLRRGGSGTTLVAIGQLAEAMPESLLAPAGPFGVCVAGEPEDTIRELARAVREGRGFGEIAGLVLPGGGAGAPRRTARRAYALDPDRFVPPAHGCFPLERYAKLSCHVPVIGPVRWGWLLTSRGCPCGCTFCSPTLRKSFGARYRVHSQGYVLAEVERLQHEHGCNALAIEDDHFTFDRERTLALCAALAARPKVLPWTAQSRIDGVDEPLVAAMRAAGCAGLCIGIESADVAARRTYKKCALTNAEIEERVAAVHAAGIHTTLYFMLGFPGESKRDMQATLDFARRLRPLMIQVAFYTPYPGSRAWTEVADEQAAEAARTFSHYNATPRSTGLVAGEDVRAFQRHFYRSFYLDPAYLWRYGTRRLPYTLTQGRELPLLAKTLTWMAARRLAG